MDQNTGKNAPPLRKTLLKSLPSLPQPAATPGITFSRFGVMLGAAVVVAALGWAFFMGFMVGKGKNPSQQVAEATSFLRENGKPGEQASAQNTAVPGQAEATQAAAPASGQIPAPLGQSGALAAAGNPDSPTAANPAPNTPVNASGAAAPAFDPHARPQGESLAAWGKTAQTSPVTPAASNVQETKKAPVANKPAPSKPVASGPKFLFTYQMGAFKSKAAAEAMQKKLSAKGQRSTVSQNGKVWLVTFQVRGTEDQARNARIKLEQQGFGKALLTSRKAVK